MVVSWQATSSRLVGRSAELAHLRGLVDGSGSAGARRLVLVVGEAGVGKSRLVREVAAYARSAGVTVLSGRAVPCGEAYRPLVEALTAALRDRTMPTGSALRPYLPALAAVLPDARVEGPPDRRGGVVLGEGVLRLIAALAGRQGAMLVLEDLHWVDPDSLDVLTYLAHAAEGAPLLLIGTARDEPEAPPWLVDVAAASTTRVVRLDRLGAADVRGMIEACLPASPPEELVGFTVEHADGLPLLVEELLTGLVAEGALAPEGRLTGPLTANVPRTFAATVRHRLAALDPPARRVVEAAAVLGRRFDWRLLLSLTGLAEPAVLAALRSAVASGLVAVDAEDTFRFRHALTCDAVRNELLPPEHRALARAAAAVVERQAPAALDLAAGLWVSGGEDARGAELYLRAGRQDRQRGALRTADAVLTRAAALAGDRVELRREAEAALLEVLAGSGDTDRALALGERLLAAGDTSVRLTLAEVAADAGRWEVAAEWLAASGPSGPVSSGTAASGTAASEPVSSGTVASGTAASGTAASGPGPAGPGPSGPDASGPTGGPAPDPADPDRGAGPPSAHAGPRAAVLAARLAHARGRPDEAGAMARAALQEAQERGAWGVACQALEVVGRAARVTDLAAARDAFAAAERLAADHGLPVERLSALHELGTVDLLLDGSTDRLVRARALALEAGVLGLAATLDLQIAATLLHRDPDASVEHAARCAEAARRLRMDGLRAAALFFRAAGHAHHRDAAAVQRCVQEAVALAPDDLDVNAGIWGAVYAHVALLDDDRPRLAACLDRAVDYLGRSPTTTPAPTRGLWALVRTLDDRDGAQARSEARPSAVNWENRALLGYADAVDAGRCGRPAQADAALAPADAAMASCPWWRHRVRLLVAPDAVAAGWGNPVGWCREALAAFARRGDDRLASRCREVLRQAGAPVPRAGRGDTPVPLELRRYGVTSREMDVLRLVAQGLPNHEIARRLVLSPRTVETHVANLVAKTKADGRAGLVELVKSGASTD